ncbi:hypothetical protein QTI33_02075 [Variovorax sp. J22P271]|uniref:hypothetical protein n=1 Tax=Variovorax davisae TaxID=3053515 RepID=UPI0025776646|nr:hypothetical protein [Variovorax sp. J22P271]MDM0030925.1 hypothetical protein [Variovorax sp. J22P271]
MINKKTIISLSCLLATSFALACRPGDLEHEVHLSPGSSTLDVAQIRSLAEWYSIWKTGENASLGIDYLWIFAKVEKGNSRSKRLAQARVSRIVRLIEQGDPNHSPVRKSIAESSIASPTFQDTVDVIAIGIQPACTRTQSCCP